MTRQGKTRQLASTRGKLNWDGAKRAARQAARTDRLS